MVSQPPLNLTIFNTHRSFKLLITLLSLATTQRKEAKKSYANPCSMWEKTGIKAVYFRLDDKSIYDPA